MLPRPVSASISVSLFRFVHHPQKSKESLPDSHIILIPWNCSENTRKGMKEIKKKLASLFGKMCASHVRHLQDDLTILRSFVFVFLFELCLYPTTRSSAVLGAVRAFCVRAPFVDDFLWNFKFAFACFLFLL